MLQLSEMVEQRPATFLTPFSIVHPVFHQLMLYIDYTEPGENDYPLLLVVFCYLVILFCRVILYIWCSPPYAVSGEYPGL